MFKSQLRCDEGKKFGGNSGLSPTWKEMMLLVELDDVVVLYDLIS